MTNTRMFKSTFLMRLFLIVLSVSSFQMSLNNDAEKLESNVS